MKIFINYHDYMISFDINNDSTIKDIKEKVRYIMHISPSEQFYVFNGGILFDNNTLSYYNIDEGNVLTLLTYLPKNDTIEIFIKTLVGKTIPLIVKPTDKVIDVQYKFQEKTGCIPDQQRFIFERKQLEVHKTLADYNIKDKSIICFTLRLRGGGNNIFP